VANRLAHSTSPYLRQHADNPVDWWEWGAEAFAEARRRDVPVLLSVGYAACHWCHVMAHESFEDPEVAEVLNAGFVPVKVDREERPDVDAVYMAATQATTGQGGWPMTCLLTPDAEPFWCGTYLPRDHFLQLLRTGTQVWRDRREEVRDGGSRIVSALRQAHERDPGRTPVGEPESAAAVRTLLGMFDRQHGGFGTAPKFPPSMVLEFLLRRASRTGDPIALQLAEETCEAMARSGMYDQLGGGFARYAVDAAWVVPHFEKMLYDNALLLRGYAHLAQAGGRTRELAARVARETAEFLLTDLLTAEGGLASSLDADTDGVEGATYVWTPEQLVEVLGAEDGARAAELLGVTPEGTFEHGTSTLRLPRDPADRAWWQDVRSRLREARAARPQPARDDKVVTAWNGLAVAALAEAGWLFDEPDWIAAAERTADLLLGLHVVDGRLRRASRGGVVGAADGVAEDYGNLVEGLVVLHAVTGAARWADAAGELLEAALERFGDGEGGFHDTAHDAEQLVFRPRSRGDNAEPCGQSALAGALVGYGALTGSSRHLELGAEAVAAMGEVIRVDPRFAGWALAVGEQLLTGPLEVAVSEGPGQAELVATVRDHAPVGTLVVAGRPGSGPVPLLEGRGPVDGRAAAYVCRGTVCSLPITDPAVLVREVGAPRLQ
jgi:uncharacterized protein YyaL (SSP411 family)